jgi:hypothetical protein
MDQLPELSVADIDPNQSEVSWIDTTAQAGIDFHYVVTALDSETLPNESAPSKVVVGRAVDTVPPEAPQWVSAEWVIYDAETEDVQSWPKSGVIPPSHSSAIRLELSSTAPFHNLYRLIEGEKSWQPLHATLKETAGNLVAIDLGANPDKKASYRGNASNHLGVTSRYSSTTTVERASVPIE